MSAPTDAGARHALDMMIRGFMLSRMLRLVADLGVADRVPEDGSVPVATLAEGFSVREDALRRVLRALAAFGVFSLSGEAVAHTATSRLLRSDAPGSLRAAARLFAADGSWRAWGSLDVALGGGVPHEAAWGMGRFERLRAEPAEQLLFDAAMAAFPGDRHGAIARALDLSGVATMVDVGGGNGETLRRVLAGAPGVSGIVFDQPQVVGAIAPDELMSGRIAVAAGDFRQAVPAGGDLYILVRVLHDWDDAGCAAILDRVRAAARPGARVVVAEQLLDPDPSRGAPQTYLADMQMMAMFGAARERTEAEFRALLETAGFTWRGVTPTGTPIALLEVVAA
jgi:hypothetical protein